MGLGTDFVEVSNEHRKRWVVEHLEEEEDCTSSIDVQVTPDVQPGNVKNVYDGVADVDASEYGTRHPWSAEERPGINDPQCIDDGPNDEGKGSWCDLYACGQDSILKNYDFTYKDWSGNQGYQVNYANFWPIMIFSNAQKFPK